MDISQPGEPGREPLRLWPGVLAVVLQWLAWLVVPVFVSAATGGYIAVAGGFLLGLAIVVWWAFFSRAPRSERWGAVLLAIVALVATSRFVDESIATGMMGMLFAIYSVPVLSLAFVAWVVASSRLSDGLRRATMLATILLACGGWTAVRTNGVSGAGHSDFAWRWSRTAEERLLAEASDEPAAGPVAASSVTVADWPGFRGPGRDGVIRGVRIETDWSASPPVELWRRPVGPGWSSFAVAGDLLYTQEQRGEDEVVACYNAATGEPVWRHRDAARFWESNAGPGPRATPTLTNGRVYTFGATGIVNVLEAVDGSVVWSRNAALETGTTIPVWGFASSPLVLDDAVIVAARGRLAAYDLATGDPRWSGPDAGWSYSSPQAVTIDGVLQIMLLGARTISVAPADGKLLWQHPWAGGSIVQPAQISDGHLLITALSGAAGIGTRRLAVAERSGGWSVEERWTSIGLKPYFNDYVVHEGHAYGFDGRILACIDLEQGRRKWKGGRYGHGQLVVLADQDLLLVLSEQGELALVAAVSDEFREIARFPAIEGKTWNHPVLIDDLLLVRNGREMAAFRLSLASDSQEPTR